MFTRREIVTHGAVGALAASALPSSTAEAAAPLQENADIVRQLIGIQAAVRFVPSVLETNTLTFGYVPKLRTLFTAFVQANQKFPDFCEAGMGVFYDMYDWHVKHQQALQVGRTAENRLTIRFMYTTLIIRLDVESGYLGQPFDRT